MLVVTRALPNPAGKDRRPPFAPINDQLNNEWLEFGNLGDRPVSLENVGLFHYTFAVGCLKTGEDRLMTFQNSLQPRHSVRVHTGSGPEWVEGTIHHVYAGRGNFAWNNACSDTAVLRNAQGSLIDWAAYDRNPPEGVILDRIPGTNRLAVTVPAYVRR
jgi:hypothetical protein